MGSASNVTKSASILWAIGVLVLAMLVLGAIAGPKFIRFQARSIQGEAKANLRGLYMAEREYITQHGTAASQTAALNWSPERGNRYAYFIEESASIPSDQQRFPGASPTSFSHSRCTVTSGTTKSGTKISLGGAATDFIIVAVRADGSGESDCWSIASMDRVAGDGVSIPFGQPFNEMRP